jgi:hypothetical protein
LQQPSFQIHASMFSILNAIQYCLSSLSRSSTFPHNRSFQSKTFDTTDNQRISIHTNIPILSCETKITNLNESYTSQMRAQPALEQVDRSLRRKVELQKNVE